MHWKVKLSRLQTDIIISELICPNINTDARLTDKGLIYIVLVVSDGEACVHDPAQLELYTLHTT